MDTFRWSGNGFSFPSKQNSVTLILSIVQIVGEQANFWIIYIGYILNYINFFDQHGNLSKIQQKFQLKSMLIIPVTFHGRK